MVTSILNGNDDSSGISLLARPALIASLFSSPLSVEYIVCVLVYIDLFMHFVSVNQATEMFKWTSLLQCCEL